MQFSHEGCEERSGLWAAQKRELHQSCQLDHNGCTNCNQKMHNVEVAISSCKQQGCCNKGVATSFAPWSLAAPFSIRKRGVLRCRLRTVLNDGVHPWANLGSSVALASSDSAVSWTCPCSAAWSKGVLPSLCASLGFRGCFSNCPRMPKSNKIVSHICRDHFCCVFVSRWPEFQEHRLNLRWSRIYNLIILDLMRTIFNQKSLLESWNANLA